MTAGPRVALLPWGHVIEDYLDAAGLTFASFCNELTGGWMFGYVEALKRAGIETVIVCVSGRQPPGRCIHGPTGAEIRVLPASPVYRRLRPLMRDPYGWSFERMFGNARRGRRRLRLVRVLAPYAATPPVALARVLREARCSVVLCQEYEDPRFDVSVVVGRLLGLPVFATFQGGDYQLSRAERLARPAALRACAGLIATTAQEETRLRLRYALPAARIHRIPNPIDLSAWQPLPREQARSGLGVPAGARVAIWHGRVEIHNKGLDVLLEAWRLVREQQPTEDPRLLLLGDGPDAEKLDARLAARSDVRRVPHDLIQPPSLRAYLALADVYVFPSRHEGAPVEPIEAMACGLPVVAADVPGVVDILAGGERDGGILVPRGDPESLAGALVRLLGAPELSERLGAQARRRVEETCSAEVVGGQLRAVLVGG